MNSSRLSAGALALGLSLLVEAQAMAAAPADARASGASLPYQSAFADYKPYQDVPMGDWKALNDTVRDSGDGQMDMGSMDKGHDMSMPAGADPAEGASLSAPMQMDDARSMPGKKPPGKSSSPAPMQMDGAHPMPGAKP